MSGLANGIADEQEPNFEDPDDYVDQTSDQDLLGDLYKQKPLKYDGLSASVVIDGLPQVGPEKLDKLKSVITKLLNKYGNPVTVEYPLDENGNNKEFMFVEFETATQAMDIVKALEKGHRLDKQHKLEVNAFHDIKKYSNISEDWEEPKPNPYVDQGNLKSWLLDKDCFDQFGIVHDQGMTTTVFQNTNNEPSIVKSRPGWTESIICWSPKGTYLATCHFKGIALWAGDFENRIQRFTHEDVNYLDFSPSENYLVTFSEPLAKKGDQHAIIIWDIRSGAKKRWFPVEEEQCPWPLFKWSHDDKYFAKMNTDSLSVYGVHENPAFGLLDKKPLKITGIRGFSWSPSDNIIAYWIGTDDNNLRPSRVVLMEMPSKNELRSKQLFNVADCKMYWHKQGDYLCVQVHRYTKAKKEKSEKSDKNEKNDEMKYSGLYYNYEIFHLREKLVPVDSLEIRETVINFAWEPCGSKFGIITGETSQHSVLFYEIKDGKVVLLKRYEGKTCNQLYWSPAGQFVLLASPRGGMVRSLEWIDTSDMTITAKNEHFMMSEVEWDPTGRYVVTSVSWWEYKTDNAYWVWSFNGRLIRKCPMAGFCQFSWRPRPPTLLSAEKIAEIKKNLKNYSNQFDLKDKAATNLVSRTLQEKRKKLVSEFESYRKNKRQALEALKQDLDQLRDSTCLENIQVVNVEETLILMKEEQTVL